MAPGIEPIGGQIMRVYWGWLDVGPFCVPVYLDKPFPNFKASKSVDRRTLCSSGTSCDGFYSSKIVKGLVGTGKLIFMGFTQKPLNEKTKKKFKSFLGMAEKSSTYYACI